MLWEFNSAAELYRALFFSTNSSAELIVVCDSAAELDEHFLHYIQKLN